MSEEFNDGWTLAQEVRDLANKSRHQLDADAKGAAKEIQQHVAAKLRELAGEGKRTEVLWYLMPERFKRHRVAREEIVVWLKAQGFVVTKKGRWVRVSW